MAFRVGEQRACQRRRVDGAVFRSKQRAEAGRCGRKSLRHFLRFQPVAAQSRLTLLRHGIAKPLGFARVERERGDAFAPQADVDPGGLRQGRR